MNTIKKSFVKLLTAVVLLTVMLNISACSDDPVSPGLENISGLWDGTIDHPGYDSGTISLNILQNNDNLSGTFSMTLVINNRAQNSSGTIEGTKVSSVNYSLSLIGLNFTPYYPHPIWVCDLNLNSVTLSGDWKSTTGNLSGNLSVQKD